MNKKKLAMFCLPILALALVSAVAYYGFLEFNVTVDQPISINGDGLVDISCLAGSTCVGDVITIRNGGAEDSEISVLVTDSSSQLTTGVVGEVLLSQKDETDNWNESNVKALVKYTIVGDKFNYLVNSEDIQLENYVLIYYPDVSTNKEWNINNAVLIGDAETDWTTLDVNDLPVVGDYNADPDMGDSYCNLENGFDDYLHCLGAKFWLIEKSDWDAQTWDSVNTLFETDLITYTDTDLGTTNVLVPADGSVNVYPQITVDKYASGGTYPIDVTIA